MTRDEPRNRATWGILAAAVCAIAWRAPLIWWEPRFWGEEASLYFAYARQHGFLASLFFVPTGDFPAGYLLLAANLPATLAALWPLETAPRVTTAFAGLVQLAPIAVVLFGDSPLWRTTARRTAVRRAIVCAVLVFAPAVVGEVWLNTINSQVFCGLTAAMILVSDAPTGRLRWAFRGLLVFCGLSGPYTAFLAPVFWLATRIDRSREAILQWRIVLATAAVQASIFLWTAATFPLAPERFESGRWALRCAAAAYHFVIRSLLGEPVGLRLAELLGLRRPLGPIADEYWSTMTRATVPEPAGPLVGWVALGVVAAVLAWLGRRGHPRAHLLSVAAVLSGVLVTLSIGSLYAAGRYAVVPGTLLLLRVAVAAWDQGPAWRRYSAALLLSVGLLAGIVEFRTETPPGVFGGEPGRPSWTREVAAWRQDPDEPLRIWPYNLDVPNRLLLSPTPEAGADLRAYEAPTFRLTSTGEWATWRLPAGELPEDFRLVFDFETSRPVGELELEMRWLDRRGEPLAIRRVDRCEAVRSCRVIVQRSDLRARDGGLEDGRVGPVYGLEIALRSPSEQPARLVATRLRMARRLEGALEPLLVARRSVEGRRAPLAGEATTLEMAESWRLDGDFAFDHRDLDRVRRRWAPGTRLDLRRDGDRLAYRGSHLHAFLGGTLSRGREGVLSGLELAACLLLLAGAARRGVAPSLSVPFVLASWAGVRLISAGATWIPALVLWIGLVVDWRAWIRDRRWAAVVAPGVAPGVAGALAAGAILDSPVFLPLALVVAVGRFSFRRETREIRSVLLSLLVSVLVLAAFGALVTRAGGLPWWSAGEPVVLAREAFAPDETRALVIPPERAAERGVGAGEEALWPIPDIPFAPLVAYPLVVVWAFVWIRQIRRSWPGRGAALRLDEKWPRAAVTLAALGAAGVLAWFLSPPSRVGPLAWATLYPLLLAATPEWPSHARRIAQGLAFLWILAVLGTFL